MEQLFSQLFANTDKNILEISDPQKESGTTACICFIENLQGIMIGRIYLSYL